MKTRHFVLRLTFLTVLVTLISCEPYHSCLDPTKSRASEIIRPLLTGAQRQLYIYKEDSNPDEYEVLYSTSDTSIATITPTGMLIGRKPGNILVHVQVTRPICGCHWENDYNYTISDTLQLDSYLEERIIREFKGDTNHDGVITKDEMNNIETIDIRKYSELIYTIPKVRFLACADMDLDMTLVPELYALKATNVNIKNIPPDNQIACLFLTGSPTSPEVFTKLEFLYFIDYYDERSEDSPSFSIDEISKQPELVINISKADSLRYFITHDWNTLRRNVRLIVSPYVYDKLGKTEFIISRDTHWSECIVSFKANKLNQRDHPFLFNPIFESTCGQLAWDFENNTTIDFSRCDNSIIHISTTR